MSSSSSSSSKDDEFSNVLPKLMPVIRAASSLAAQDVKFHKSVDASVGKEIDQRSEELLSIVNGLLRCTSSSDNRVERLKFGEDNIASDSAWNPIGNIIDSIFEKIDYTIDQRDRSLSNSGQPQKQYLEDGLHGSKGQDDEKNGRIAKPQLLFKTPVDNSEQEPFKPKLTSKPNALQSLESVSKLVNPAPVYEDTVEIVEPAFYPHPYQFEIDQQPYPAAVLEKAEPIPPTDWATTQAIWVDTVEALDIMIEELERSEAIAVDLEHHDYRSYYGLVCLMQISNREKDWVIDTLALRDELSKLNVVFTNSNIVKVFHGAFMDIIWLQRDLGLYVVSLFDTYHASRQLGFPKFSLQYLLDTFAHFRTSKTYQLADWRIRPLSPPMMAYARSDTHFLLFIYDQLRNMLIKQDKLPRVLFESRQVAKRRFEYTKFRPLTTNFSSQVTCPVMSSNPKEPWGSIIYQYNVPAFKKHLVEVLYNYRDMVAKAEDESVRYIMPNQLLVALAMLEGPVDSSRIINVPSFVTEHVRLHAREIAELIEQSKRDSEQNDWDLVDRWHNNDATVSEPTLDAGKIGAVFEKLLTSSSTMFEQPALLAASSFVFDVPGVDNEMQSSRKAKNNSAAPFVFEVSGGDLVKRSLDDLRERFESSQRLLSEFYVSSHSVLEEEEERASETPQAAATAIEAPREEKELTGQQKLFNADKRINPDEVITLRKNKTANKPSKQPEQEDSPAVDYANADKILIGSSDNKKENKKKRSFDPFAKVEDGPKPAKKKKVMTAGKTSTFKLKKSRMNNKK
ncbi:uncharacterized protein LODBEIA_P26430 [Lodderomyces beijingensis]|uniref:HRDC domain-containing protein n=1 Tax=Lodderomyces beijingensis TaxID=1775926 RepID=A0ABP0ZKL3_9ASCO